MSLTHSQSHGPVPLHLLTCISWRLLLVLTFFSYPLLRFFSPSSLSSFNIPLTYHHLLEVCQQACPSSAQLKPHYPRPPSSSSSCTCSTYFGPANILGMLHTRHLILLTNLEGSYWCLTLELNRWRFRYQGVLEFPNLYLYKISNYKNIVCVCVQLQLRV